MDVLPRCLMPDESVQGGQKLPHASRQGYFLRLAGGQQPFVERFNHRVVASSDKSPHVESGADMGPTTPDPALAAESAAVPVERGDAHKSGDLPPVKSAQLW